MCTDEQHKKICDLLKGQSPIDFMEKISDLQFWQVDYRERKHLFVWVPSATVISAEDFTSSMSIPATSWSGLAFPPGTKIQTSGSTTTTVPLFLRATDETIP